MIEFNADEISSVIRQEIADYHGRIDVRQVGTVLEVGDGIAHISGLSDVMAGEMVEFESGVLGQAFNLEESTVGAVIYGDCDRIREGDTLIAGGSGGIPPRVLDRMAHEVDAVVIDQVAHQEYSGGRQRTQHDALVRLLFPRLDQQKTCDQQNSTETVQGRIDRRKNGIINCRYHQAVGEEESRGGGRTVSAPAHPT